MASEQDRQAAERLWEGLGGDLCVCQRTEVPHWCEGCQLRLGTLTIALATARAEGYRAGLERAAEIAETYTGPNWGIDGRTYRDFVAAAIRAEAERGKG